MKMKMVGWTRLFEWEFGPKLMMMMMMLCRLVINLDVRCPHYGVFTFNLLII